MKLINWNYLTRLTDLKKKLKSKTLLLKKRFILRLFWPVPQLAARLSNRRVPLEFSVPTFCTVLLRSIALVSAVTLLNSIHLLFSRQLQSDQREHTFLCWGVVTNLVNMSAGLAEHLDHVKL